MKNFKSKSCIAVMLTAIMLSVTGNLNLGMSKTAYAQELDSSKPFYYVGYNALTNEETTYVWDEDEQIGKAINVETFVCDEREKLDKHVDDIEYEYEYEPSATFASTTKLIEHPEDSEQYANTVFISVTDAYGGTARGTGFLIAPNAVVTAGHMVYDDGTSTDGVGYGGNGWITSSSITVANGTWSSTPKATTRGIEYHCGYDWAKKGDLTNDWGLILLEDSIADCDLSHFKLGYIDGAVGQTNVSLNGYPASTSTDTPTQSEEIWAMYEVKGYICSESDATKPLRSNNMVSYAGASGGPCYKTSGFIQKDYSVIGIYSHKNRYNTYYTKIDSGLYNFYKQYMK